MFDFKNKVVYQIYPKSFYDSNNDGLGDIKGMTEKLDYIKELGVDYIWSTPFFKSPQNDNGYDVADYYSIDPSYGTMEDVEELIEEADKRGIALMFDMVFNHTSTEHEWFKKALAGDEYYKDFYIFKDPVDGKAPTNWVSKFGGNAWEYSKEWGQYYLHLFDVTQADLNWENPNVRKALADVVKFWIDKGVKGFRFDVVNLISKPDTFENDYEGDGRRFYTDGKKVNQYLKELCKESGITGNDILTVGEMSSTTLENCAIYSDPREEELSMCFNFHHLKVDYKNNQKWEVMPYDFQMLKDLYNEWQLGMQERNGWNALFWNNHDQPRALSRFCNDTTYRSESAKMLGACIHLMQGTPYIYQGEEIGMTNAGFRQIDKYKDVESHNYFKILQESGKTEEEAYDILNERSRDNARTPMQWNGNEGGFTSANPWIDMIDNYKEVNVENELKSEDSVFSFYQELIKLRKEYKVVSEGLYEVMLEKHPQIFAYKRSYDTQEMLVFNNFFEKTVEIPYNLEGYKCILNNYNETTESSSLKPFQTKTYIKI